MCDGYAMIESMKALAKEDAERHRIRLDMRPRQIVENALKPRKADEPVESD